MATGLNLPSTHYRQHHESLGLQPQWPIGSQRVRQILSENLVAEY
jgi:hypothetical protein